MHKHSEHLVSQKSGLTAIPKHRNLFLVSCQCLSVMVFTVNNKRLCYLQSCLVFSLKFDFRLFFLKTFVKNINTKKVCC